MTTTFTRETQLRVDLPEAVSGSPAEDQQVKQLDIAISADGVFSVNNQLLPKNDLASLMEALQKESDGDTNLPLSISADGKTQHQSVITAMDAAGKLGFSHLRMTTVEAASPRLMAISDRLLAAWYEGHPALTLLRPLESLYRRVVQRKRARFLAGEGEIYQATGAGDRGRQHHRGRHRQDAVDPVVDRALSAQRLARRRGQPWLRRQAAAIAVAGRARATAPRSPVTNRC